MLNSNHDEEIHESGGAYIVRIPCGCKEKYIEKELLWPYIPEFVDGALGHILNIFLLFFLPMSGAFLEYINGQPNYVLDLG